MRILAFQPRWAHGGGELVAAWMLEALRREHEVTAVTLDPPDLEQANDLYGTTLQPGEVELRPLPRRLRVVAAGIRLSGLNFNFHRHILAMRYARRLAAEYELAYSALDEADLGGGGLQYVHHPWVGPAYRAPTLEAIRRAPKRPWQLISGHSLERIRSNVTLVNSRFTAAAVERQLGVTPRVVTPPVPGRFPDPPWEERQDAVVAVGRLIRHKRLDMAVETVAEARARGLPLRLRIVGSTAGIDPAEVESILGLARGRDWVDIHPNVSRDELVRLIAGCRYGIHCCDEEPFGIAVAEMVLAGCIPIVRPTGGPTEIVGADPRLFFDSPAAGAARLIALSRSAALRREIGEGLRARRADFTPERFVAAIRETVAELSPSP
ncbi:MAG: glycosyltransferase family 4 protein [Solirubrobacterales bacterium]